MKNLDIYGWVALILVLIGGIDLGLMGLFNLNLIFSIFGTVLSRLIFIVIGVAAGYLCYMLYAEKMKKTP